ncbi:hypothetical protein QUA42_15105 [Microcoleus sp. Pol11C2]|uniref:hypothetical protein n=1 Tax=Microcoleus sp. Pol11C2 TaxID=3055389 RepID=UPI002FD2DAC0
MTVDKIWSDDHASLRDTGRKNNKQLCSLGLKKLLATVDNKNIDFTIDQHFGQCLMAYILRITVSRISVRSQPLPKDSRG